MTKYYGVVMSELTYRKAGVDIEEGERFVRMITPLLRRTSRPEVMSGLGSFGALFKLDASKYRQPVLVSGTDGVGTKLRVAFMADRHDTVGVDLVAMCVNDILTLGAEPLFFLDYFATGKLHAEAASTVMEGMVKGCEEAGCSLIGGETAEMPGFYADGEYDLSGFSVGVVEKDEIIDGSAVREGDVVVGLASNGIHSNGFSLVRKIFFEKEKIDIFAAVPELGTTVAAELLKPTRIYVKAFNALKGRVRVNGMAHITGGGIPGNLPRILPEGVCATLNKGSWPEQSIFRFIEETGNVPEEDMKKTFNMGIGYIIIVPGDIVDKTLEILNENSYDCYIIGGITKGEKGVKYV